MVWAGSGLLSRMGKLRGRLLVVGSCTLLAVVIGGCTKTENGAPDASQGGAGGTRADASATPDAGLDAGCPGAGGAPSMSEPQIEPGRTPATAATGCTDAATTPDECACGDLACAERETCLRVFQEPRSAIGGPGSFFNACFEVCARDSDCDRERVCAKNQYGVRECVPWSCREDSDCSEDPCGWCRHGFVLLHIAGWIPDETSNSCVYAGPCGPDSCQPCSAFAESAHFCE